MNKLITFLATGQSSFINLTRISIFFVMAWIGGLKTCQYEADGIVQDFPTPQFGFPYLSGAGRLVLKDIIMLAAGLMCASESAKRLLREVK